MKLYKQHLIRPDFYVLKAVSIRQIIMCEMFYYDIIYI